MNPRVRNVYDFFMGLNYDKQFVGDHAIHVVSPVEE
jgi:hypothetical protein